ncbi:MAG: radical SAM protein [Candidatus Omnitrophota bacterium]|jgi:uncharacterized protein|nr:MAG: radical SAM protein [Candidatus Omnitrophota bacterium]
MSDIPFIHLFSTDTNKYVYDVNSNDIIKVDDIAYDYFHLLLSGFEPDECKYLLTNEYDSSAITKSIAFIQEIEKAELYFSKTRPQEIALFCCENSMKYTYSNYINQLTLEVTQRCNLNCRYCIFSGIYEQSRPHTKKDMTWKIAKSGLDFMFQYGGRDPNDSILLRDRFKPKEKSDFTIGFYGGEPLLNFELIQKCITYCRQNAPTDKKVGFVITTNGTLLSDDIIEYFIANNVAITISFDGPQNIHDKFRIHANGKGTHQEALNAIKRINYVARKMNLPETLYCLINCLVLGGFHFRELFDYFVSLENLLDNEYVHFDLVINTLTGGLKKWNDCYPEEQLEKPAGYEELLEEYKSACLAGKYKNDNNHTFYFDILNIFAYNNLYFDLHARTRHQFSDENEILETSHPGCICKLGSRRPFLTVDGRILPCERVFSENPSFYVGRIDTGLDLNKIKSMLDDFTNSTIEECRDCWCYRICDVGCINDNYEEGVFDARKKMDKCRQVRARRHSELVGMMKLLEQDPTVLDHYNEVAVS